MRLGIMFQPGRFTTTGATVKQLIALSYDVRDFQVTGGPSWISSDKFDIDAKEPDGLSDELEKLSLDQRHEKMGMLIQSLLADRFALKVSHATKDLPVYALVVAKGGPKLQAAKADDTNPNGMKDPDGHPLGHGNFMRLGLGELEGQSVPVTFLAQELARQLGRNVLDQTGLKGSYDFTLKWAPDPSSMAMMQGPPGGGPPPGAGPAPDSGSPPDASGPSIFTAVQEQLGLKLESTKGPVDILIIDQDIHGAPRRFEFQPKLFLHRRENGAARNIGRRSLSGAGPAPGGRPPPGGPLHHRHRAWIGRPLSVKS